MPDKEHPGREQPRLQRRGLGVRGNPRVDTPRCPTRPGSARRTR
jgi:hypothetical protein